MDASGSIAKTLTASKWKSRAYIRGHTQPTNRQTVAQQANRALMADAIVAWRLLTPEEKQVQNLLGASRVRPIPGYNFFISGYISAVPEPDPFYPVGSDCLLYHAYWNGDALDHSLAGNNGSVVGATFGPTGLTFAGGTQTVNVPGPISFGAGDFTIFLWANMTAPAAGQYSRPYASTNIGDASYSLIIYEDFRIIDAGYHSSVGYGPRTDSPADPSMSQVWKFYAHAVDRDTVSKFYKNVGTPNEGTYITTYQFNDLSFNIGGKPGDGPFVGIIGEVLIFNTLKDPAAITDYFNSTRALYGV